MVSAPPAFKLRFPPAQIDRWARSYSYGDDDRIEAIGSAARQRGWYTRDEFLELTRWKTARTRSRCERNSEIAIREAFEVACRVTDERLRIGILTALDGVHLPTASVLLHFAHPDPYPIIDFRALWSLGVPRARSYYSFEFWLAYVQACRNLAGTAGVPMRTLDRALWQYSKVRQRA